MAIEDQYVSNAPAGGISIAIFLPFNRVPSRDKPSLAGDQEEHGKYTNKIELANMDTSAMLDTYHEMGGSTRYNFWDLNCSTIVAKLLLAGYTHKLLGVPFFDDLILKIQSGTMFAGIEQTIGHRIDTSHRRYLEHGLSIVESALMFASRGRAKPNVTKMLVSGFSSDVASRALIWYPGQVLLLAKYLKEHGA
jgi:hypothetical protein